MKKIALILLIVSPALAYGQQISISPISIRGWGSAPATMKFTASYRQVEAVFLYAAKPMWDGQGGHYGGKYFGMFWEPIDFNISRLELEGGVGYFFRKFPTVNGSNVNFTAKATYNITDIIGIQYSHISNGFGIQNKLNPGIDNISLVISL